ncbi:Dynactin subunit 3 [Daphnia magna]|uniref:Dynactin subunit 3 n=1 Tax=Daphnia magna TaxID=35525 RepID=A0A164PXH1_9CRUS|nr:Dynactin subunit 3 [Daphnia magna]
MSTELDLVEERIKRLEKFVLGQGANEHGEEKLIDTLLGVSEKLATVVSKNEKVSSALKRADEVKKYADPLFAESDGLISENVKLQLLYSKEGEIKDALGHLQKLNIIKSVLDSQAIKDVPHLEGEINKISFHQEIQEKKVLGLSNDTYALIKYYSNFVNDVSQKLAEIEKLVCSIEEQSVKQ